MNRQKVVLIEGVPVDGYPKYLCSKIGKVKKGGLFINDVGILSEWCSEEESEYIYPIVHKIEKPKQYKPFDDIEFKKRYNNEWCCMKTSMNSGDLPMFKIVYADSEGVSFINRGVSTVLTYKEAFDKLYLLSEGTKPGIFGMEIEE